MTLRYGYKPPEETPGLDLSYGCKQYVVSAWCDGLQVHVKIYLAHTSYGNDSMGLNEIERMHTYLTRDAVEAAEKFMRQQQEAAVATTLQWEFPSFNKTGQVVPTILMIRVIRDTANFTLRLFDSTPVEYSDSIINWHSFLSLHPYLSPAFHFDIIIEINYFLKINKINCFLPFASGFNSGMLFLNEYGYFTGFLLGAEFHMMKWKKGSVKEASIKKYNVPMNSKVAEGLMDVTGKMLQEINAGMNRQLFF